MVPAHDPSPPQLSPQVRVGAPHDTPPPHDFPPLHCTSHESALQLTILVQVSCSTHPTEHREPAHATIPLQLPTPVHWIAHAVPCEQSTPPAQAPAPEQTTRHGTEGGHSTRAPHPPLSSQRITHSPPEHVPPLLAQTRSQSASGPSVGTITAPVSLIAGPSLTVEPSARGDLASVGASVRPTT